MLGNAGKRLARLVDLAEELYERVVELREAVGDLRETTEATGDRVERLEEEVAAQGAVLDALAERQGVDVETVREGARDGEGTAGDDDGRTADAPSTATDGR